MDTQQLTIATMSWARNEGEETLLREALTVLAGLQIPVYITDGGSAPGFIDFLRSFPHFHVLPPAKGLWPQAHSSLQQAYESGRPFIFYTEPDKARFFRDGLPKMLREVEVGSRTGIINAARSPTGFSSFPAFQQMTETTINNCCAELMGNVADYTYGPFLLNREVVPHLLQLPANIGWGWRPFAFHTAHRLGLSVSAFEGDFFCPEDQRQDDPAERVYRMKQLTQNIEGLTLSVAAEIKK